MKNKKAYKKKKSIALIIISTSSILLLLIALLSVLYPTISYIANDMTDITAVNSYTDITSTLTENEKESYIKEAKKYNNRIAQLDITESFKDYDETINGYDNILNIDNGIMGSVSIPKINMMLPIYHGTSEDVLSEGAGHLSNTSFPIGGSDTHAVISAHTAYPGKIFFDDLPKLEENDIFYIDILGDTLIYKVIKKEIVDPDNVESLKITEGKDYVSLVTCYPYAVNTHRLIVTGERMADNETENNSVLIKDIGQIDYLQRYQLLFIILFILTLIIILTLIVSIIQHIINNKKIK